MRSSKVALIVAVVAITAVLPMSRSAPASAFAARPVNCSAATFTLHPGLHPAPPNTHLAIAPDIPRIAVHVSLPLFPQSAPLSPFVGSPFFDYPTDPYLQTAAAEYLTSDDPGTVQSWFSRVVPVCGWKHSGSGSGNVAPFDQYLFFVSRANPELTVEFSFGPASSGGTDVAYAVEEVTYPPRPAASYLHGPFVKLRVALGSGVRLRTPRVSHLTVLDRRAISRLVSAINRLTGYHTDLPLCSGGGASSGPAWLSFVRRNGSVVHAFEGAPGVCGGLAVNGVRWLIDTGSVWNQINALAGGRG